METEIALGRMHANLRALLELLGSSAPASRILRLPGVVGSCVPDTPDRSLLNVVTYERPVDLFAAHAQLDRDYRAAGVRAWSVWLMAGHDDVARFLEERGHKFDGGPMAMLLDLEELAALPLDALDWSQTADVAIFGRITDQAFGFPTPAFSAAMRRIDDPAVRLYLARDSGEPVSTVMTCDVEGDCGIYCVATLEAARGKGLSSRLMSAVLLEARRRGCATASLQASSMGYPIYRKLGFRDLGRMALWELRRA